MHTIARIYTPHLTRAMATCAVLVALSVFIYGVFLLEAVGNTAQRAAAERQIHTLTSQVSTLEQTYLSKTREMTLERAHTLGYVTPEKVTTVFATEGSDSLSLNH